MAKTQPLTKSTATGTPIKIGVVASLSDKPLPATAGPEGLKAWAATVNGKGGLQGHPVEIVVRDDGNDPAKSLTAVKQLVEKDERRGHHLVDRRRHELGRLRREEEHPGRRRAELRACLAGEPGLLPRAVDARHGDDLAAVDGQERRRETRSAPTTPPTSPAAVEAVKAKDAIATSLGLKAIFNAAISSSQPDFTAPCLAGKKAGVDAMMLSGVPVERITPSCAQQGFTPKWILPGENVTAEVLKTPELGDVLGAADGVPVLRRGRHHRGLPVRDGDRTTGVPRTRCSAR